MPLIRAASGNNIDDGTRRLAILRPISVAQHLELSDGFQRRIDENCTIRANVIIISSVHQEEVVHHGIAIDGEIHSTLQPLSNGIERARRRNAGRHLRQLYDASSIKTQST